MQNNYIPRTGRMLIVYPWTERYFETFGDIFSADTILNNSKVAAHGIVVLKELDKAVKNMDNIEGTYAALSRLHCEKLTVDPENFRVSNAQSDNILTVFIRLYTAWINAVSLFCLQLIADCITISVACKLRSALDHQAQATWQKFLSVVAEAMSSQYY